MPPSTQAGALVLGQGIGKNEFIQSFTLHSEGEDCRDVHLIEPIPAKVAALKSISTALPKAVATSIKLKQAITSQSVEIFNEFSLVGIPTLSITIMLP